ncbi:DUF255 domain-containing protein [Streptomyces tirandamycinicus]|uniref:Spermatogenesis-associated protein 20-like TRX domain-containing protein n=1 Tax=Streptomyces tirandamycinicus TaxID=2174846 RepID=A0A2S1SWE2_9ACTN|nr:DUF255 domain-containing protein [Streptomyces tirandamycinicus]AWI30676.1 hypothetical protein DDW44_19220 [Streptomyces tirandamycinicus]
MNRSAGTTSPYPLQHADNPVAWCRGDSRRSKRRSGAMSPVLLSVGYSACHWCQ